MATAIDTQIKVRPVTEAEVATFWEDGFVKLPGLIDSAGAAALLRRAKDVFGEDGCKDLVRPEHSGPQANYDYRAWFRSEFAADRLGEDVRSVARSSQLGENIARFYGRKSPIRSILNNFQVKLPRETGVGEGTGFHQDTPGFQYIDGPIISVWVAIDDVTEDMGGLVFAKGSHKLGYYGRMRGWEDRLSAFPMTSPMVLKAGDATAHIGNMYHGTGPNTSNRARWSWTTITAPGDATYTGAASPYGDNLGLKPGEVLDHTSAPIIYSPAA